MKIAKIGLIALFVICCFTSYSQSESDYSHITNIIDSLNKNKSSYYADLDAFRKEIDKKIYRIIDQVDSLDKIIVDEMKAKGYYVTCSEAYGCTIRDSTHILAKDIAKVKRGDKILIVGKIGNDFQSYYKVKLKIDNEIVIGYYYDRYRQISSLSDYPIQALERVNESLSTNKNSSHKSSSYKSSKCNSRQCSGRTKKGSRCHNVTTNCSGRCYQH
jgi:hypothetical protein